jgi:hypothetical protein
MAEWVDHTGDILEVDPVPGTDRLGFLAETEVHLDRAQVRELIEHLQRWAGPDDEPDCATGPTAFALLWMALAGIGILAIAWFAGHHL